MASNSSNVLAGVAAGGTGGTTLAWFAPTGTALPTTTAVSLNVAFKDAGYVTDAGLVRKVAETTKDILAFGTQIPVRVLTTESKRTFDMAFLEGGNLTAQSIYYRYPLTGGTALTASSGAFTVNEGPTRVQRWAAVFDVVDGTNAIRGVCPQVENTGIGDLNFVQGDAITYPVTLTAYPDSTGVAVYWYYLVPTAA